MDSLGMCPLRNSNDSNTMLAEGDFLTWKLLTFHSLSTNRTERKKLKRKKDRESRRKVDMTQVL